MDDQIIEVHENVKELQTQHRQVLKKLNEVTQNENGTKCSCKSAVLLPVLQSEIQILTSKVNGLEERETIMKELISSATEQLKLLHNKISQQSLLTDQSANIVLKQDNEIPDKTETLVDPETSAELDSKDDENVVDDETHGTITNVHDTDRTADKVGDISEVVGAVSAEENGKFVVNETTVNNGQCDNEKGMESKGPVLDDISRDRMSDGISKEKTTVLDDNNSDKDVGNIKEAVAAARRLADSLLQNKKMVSFKEKVTQKTVIDKEVASDNESSENDENDIIETLELNDIEPSGAIGGDNKPTSILRSLQRLKHKNSRMKLGQAIGSNVTSGLSALGVTTETQTQTRTPEVIRQSERCTYDSINEWQHQSALEIQSAWDAGYLNLGGVHSVLLIDISESMVPHWDQVQQFFNEYISGLETTVQQVGLSPEHVALVTFGHETKVQKRLTNEFSELRECFGKLKLGGPSPMFGGIHMSIAAVGSSDSQVVTVNNFPQLSKVILITDGYATDPVLYHGPDDPVLSNQQLGQKQLCEELDSYPHDGYDLYIVPVGNSDMEFLNKFSTVNNGKILDYKSGNQLSRRFYLMYNVDLLSLTLGFPYLTDGNELSEADFAGLMEIRANRKTSSDSKYHEEKGSILPIPGTRVRRGPDWKYDDQDSDGPGTIVGHVEGSLLCLVQWDNNGTIDAYKFGDKGKFDIKVVEEPKYLDSRETIAVGCVVKPVQDMTTESGILNEDMRGIVLRLTLEDGDIPKALVRWNDGMRGLYMYDIEHNPEVVVCQERQHYIPKPVKKITRNKNKNVS
ncbi:hypothetical protein ACF0H5_008715 [Mactra antiquata]